MPTISQIEQFTEKLNPASQIEPEAEEQKPDTETAAEVTVEQTVEQEQEQEQEQELVFFNELPEKLGLDAEAFYKLKLKTDTGEEYTLSQVKDRLQEYSRKTETLTVRERELQAKEQSLIAQIQRVEPQNQALLQLNTQLSTVVTSRQQLLSQLVQLQEEGDVNSLIRAQTQLTQLDAAERQLQAQIYHTEQEIEHTRTTALTNYKQEQFGLLLNKIPELQNDDTRKSSFTEMKEFMAKEGITPQEMSQLYDARHAAIVYKAMLWDKHQKNVAATKQTLGTGKLTTRVAGASIDRKTAERAQLDKTIERGMKSRREADKRAAIEAVAKKAGLL